MTTKILKLADNINTDDIIPATRCNTADPELLAQYAFEHILNGDALANYDVIIAGKNFGCGSSREHAALAIKAAGIKQVYADSYADIFFRNSINIGLNITHTANITEGSKDVNTTNTIDAIIHSGGLTNFNKSRFKGLNQIVKAYIPSRAMTICEKIIARSSANDFVEPGQIVFANVDLAMSHDAVLGPCSEVFYQNFGAKSKVWDRNKLVLVADHFIQNIIIKNDKKSEILYLKMKEFAQQQGCQFIDQIAPGNSAGICHIILPERGYVQPGMLITGTDSHTCTYGALGCFSFGVGTTDMANTFATGDVWLRVPPSILVHLEGVLVESLSAKEIVFELLDQLGVEGASGHVLEFRGSALKKLSMDERLTLSNMTVECGALCGIIPVDEITKHYLEARGNITGFKAEHYSADENATYSKILHINLSTLESRVACPPTPDNLIKISQLKSTKIQVAYIGSCTGGKLEDLAMAAMVLKDQTIHSGVKLYIAPASQEILKQSVQLGYINILEKAGAEILSIGCGACINSGLGSLKENETGVFSTSRNFVGRSGHPNSKVYLASPRVVAISACKGEIADRL